MTIKEFIERADKIHKNKYDYSQAKYESYHSNLIIACPKHGDFQQSPAAHLNGSGCQKCANNNRNKKTTKTTQQFIEDAIKVHGNKYDYSKVKYKQAQKKITITCKSHGDFKQTPTSHLRPSGCPQCKHDLFKKLYVFSKDDFISKAKEIHGERYDYSKVRYKNARTKIDILCKDHGVFSQTPDSHMKGVGCGKCKNKSEGRIAEYLLKNHILIRQLRINNKFFDFYLPEFNLIIERDGEQHYRQIAIFAKNDKKYLKKQNLNDQEKTKLAKKKGFKLSRIPYWLNKKEEIIEIKNILKGRPSYPEVPDLRQEKTKPKPIKNF